MSVILPTKIFEENAIIDDKILKDLDEES